MTRRRPKHILGADPGKEGGLCVLHSDGTPMTYSRMPTCKAEILDWIASASQTYPRLLLVVEKSQVMPRQGIVSAFRYGDHFGIFETACLMLRVPYHEVRPNVWKKQMGLSSKKIDSITACRRLFPNVQLVQPGCRKPHDGIAEALLIAEWARRGDL